MIKQHDLTGGALLFPAAAQVLRLTVESHLRRAPGCEDGETRGENRKRKRISGADIRPTLLERGHVDAAGKRALQRQQRRHAQHRDRVIHNALKQHNGRRAGADGAHEAPHVPAHSLCQLSLSRSSGGKWCLKCASSAPSPKCARAQVPLVRGC